MLQLVVNEREVGGSRLERRTVLSSLHQTVCREGSEMMMDLDFQDTDEVEVETSGS